MLMRVVAGTSLRFARRSLLLTLVVLEFAVSLVI